MLAGNIFVKKKLLKQFNLNDDLALFSGRLAQERNLAVSEDWFYVCTAHVIILYRYIYKFFLVNTNPLI